MHNKFIIIDGCVLATGSFNWTAQAVYGNQENLAIFESKKLVWKYSEEFNRLWEDFSETEITQEKADQAVQEAIDRNKRTQEKRKATIARNKEAKRVKAEVEHKAREEIMKMLAHDLRKEFETQELLTDDKKHLASDIVHEVVKRNLAV